MTLIASKQVTDESISLFCGVSASSLSYWKYLQMFQPGISLLRGFSKTFVAEEPSDVPAWHLSLAKFQIQAFVAEVH